MSEPVQDLRPQILHVDDDPEVLDQVKEYLEDEAVEGWGRPEVVGTTSFAEALVTLEQRRIDLVILDVRLGGHDQDQVAASDEEGVQTLAEIRNRRFVPVIFWTGLPGKVDDLTGPLVLAGDKTSQAVPDLFALVSDLFSTGLPTVNRALRRLVEDAQRRYMWEFVAEHWEELRSDGDAGLAYLLVRRLGQSLSGPGVAALAAEMGHDGLPEPVAGKIHPAEMYLVPPLPETRPGLAEIMRSDGGGGPARWWFVLTPSCDLERPQKLETVLVAECFHARDDQRVAAWITNESTSNRGKVHDLVTHKTGGQDDRWLYLPAAPTLPHLVVDFQKLASLGKDEFASLTRVGSLISPFAEAALNRFVRYYGRIGTDDLHADGVMQALRGPGE